MFRFCHKLAHHRLDDSDVSIQEPSQGSAEQSDPKVSGKADNKEREHCAGAAEQKNRFPAYPVGDRPPEHACACFRKRKGGDEDAGVEGGIALVAEMEAKDKLPGIWEN